MYAPGPLREQSKVTSPEMGTQHWYDIVVGGVTILRSAWFYPDTLPGRDNIRNHVTFATGKGISIRRKPKPRASA
ncbi:MAG: hypothetical protein WDW36_009989 [Sanguina aurantia]